MTPTSTLLLTACVISLTIGGELVANAATLPQIPQRQVDVTMPTVTGSTLNATCATLQAQINAAAALNVNLTHEVILATGTTCTGRYTLPSHTGGTGWILIKGANYASLPASGTRVGPSDTALMPTIQHSATDTQGTIHALTGAQRYRIIGIEFVPHPTAINNNWIALGYDNEASTNTGYFILDRIVIHDTGAAHDSGRAIHADSDVGHVALIDSYCSGIKKVGTEEQCFQTDTNAGPILVRNNFLEAAGEPMMVGGGIDPPDAARMPQDITFTLNTVEINPAWWGGGGGYVVKALLELKTGLRVLIEGNTFRNMSWDQGGFAHRLTVRNTTGSGTFADVSDLTIRYNLYENVTNWLQMIPADVAGAGASQGPTKHSKRWYIHNNVVSGLNWTCGGGTTCGIAIAFYGGDGSGMGCTDAPLCGFENMTIAHNTVDYSSGGIFIYDVSVNNINLDLRDNLVNLNNGWGFNGTQIASGFGTAGLNSAWNATWSWTYNRFAFLGNFDDVSRYAQGTNSYPTSFVNFLWTNRAARDYTLLPGSPAKGAASDGTDQGVNFIAYNAARAGGGNIGGGGVDLTPPAIPQNVNIMIN